MAHRMRHLHVFVRLLIVVTVCLFGGCWGTGDGRPATAPVKGSVTFRGLPVSGATVTFIGEGAPRFGSGRTDEAGRFELTTFEPGDGAVVGTHVVTVFQPSEDSPPPITIDPKTNPEGFDDAMDEVLLGAAAQGPVRSQLPDKYADAKTTDLRAEVVPSENVFKFELVD